jgi:class 3 adenylate cyclase
MEPCLVTGLPHYRTIIALDIEQSTARTDPVKADLRRSMYELFDQALRSAGIHSPHRDPYIDRGDGILALIHPAEQTSKGILLNHVIPALNQLLTDSNASLPHTTGPQRQLRIRVVMHAGEIRYDANGCFGEALDIAFRLLAATPVKRALQKTPAPLALVVSGDIYQSVVRHSYSGTGQDVFRRAVRIKIAGHCYPGWIHIPGEVVSQHPAEMASYRRIA